MATSLSIVIAISFFVGFVATEAVRRTILRLGILDRPNDRSAHHTPTPTLGGLGIVAGCWAGVGASAWAGIAAEPWMVWGLLGSTIAATVLVADEIWPMGWRAKLGVQFLAAALFVWGASELGGLASSMVTKMLLVFALVVLQNLYNFMDGLDGLAGLEGALVGSLFMVLFVAAAPRLSAVPAAVAGACAGFLILNAPPARIFMGDMGSHFLGLMFGAMAFGASEAGISPIVPVLFLGTFLYDALYTLARRLLRGENITVAHRFHLYQRLQVLGFSDARVCFLYTVITLLLGTAGCLMHLRMDGPAAAGLAAAAVMMVATTVTVERMWSRQADGEAHDGV